MTTRPSLTVVIVNHRTPQLVNESVASVLRHAGRTSVSVIVVDNGSGDDSLEIIRAAYPEITLFDAGGNLGFAGGNNIALRQVRTDYVMLLNSDAAVEPGTIDALLDVFETDATIGMAGPRVVNADDGADQDYPIHFPSTTEMVRRALFGPQFLAKGHLEPLPVARIHGACLVARTRMLREIGLLDEGFFMYDEDVDWCMRAVAAGWHLRLVPGVRVRHHGGRSSGRAPSGRRAVSVPPSETSLRLRFELRRSRYRLFRKYRGRAETILLKMLTDAILVADSCRWIIRSLLAAEYRPAAAAVLRWNIRIIALNPFRAGLR